MSASVLVTYLTRYGSTGEVAEEVAITLREHGFQVDCLPEHHVHTLQEYRAVVLGAPLYIGAWHNGAHRFLSRHRDDLRERPVAIFALGPLTNDEQETRDSRHLFESHVNQHEWLKPVAVEMFGGKYDPAKLTLPHRLIATLHASPLHGKPASDIRDWTCIHEWATELAAHLQARLVPAEA